MYEYVATRTRTTVSNFQAPNSTNITAWYDFWTSRGVDPLHMTPHEFMYSARIPYTTTADSIVGPWWCTNSSSAGLTQPISTSTSSFPYLCWQMYCFMATAHLLCSTIAEAGNRIRLNQLHNSSLPLTFVPIASQAIDLSDPHNDAIPYL